jgi:SAM-dependent methyltransferase
MTPEMVALARKNAATAGAKNVEFCRVLSRPSLPDNSVDVIISNCVINLAPDKDAVLAEAWRVLKPGGRFAVSDIVLARTLPEGLRKNIELWAGCIAGALVQSDYKAKLAAAGFEGVDIEPTRVYSSDDAGEFATAGAASDEEKKAQLAALDGAVYSAFIRGTKPL